MNLLKLSWAYILHKKLSNLLSVFLIAFAALLITLLFLITRQFESALDKNLNDIDMVIGAKGSPMQIILSSIFHIDFPTGNILLDDAEYFAGHPLVKETLPISMGDTYQGYRIVGAGEEFGSFYRIEISEGRFPKEPMEVSVGANVAEETRLKTGDRFPGSHGFSEGDDHELMYQVVGILAPQGSIADNLIFTPLTSYWEVHHSEEKNVTNLFIRYKNPMAAVRLPAIINATGNLQAAVPSFETARLFSMAGIGAGFINGVALVLITFATFSIFISMYSSLNEKKYDLAVMRSLGASGIQIFTFSLLEGIIITLLGGIVGIVSAHVAIEWVKVTSETTENLMISGREFSAEELLILGVCLGAGLLGALAPSVMAYRTDISKVLSEG